jgi:hypothetical protein
MLSITEILCELQSALDSNANEHQLIDLIDRCLSLLRASYKERRNEFTEETILFLKSLSPIRDALHEFIENVGEKEWIRTREDAQEIVTQFSELRDQLSPHLVAKRVDKEIREVIEKIQSLPFATVVAIKTELQYRIIQLESKEQPCQKCGSKMMLRESQNGYFWGCSIFPRCFSKRWLSTKQYNFLFP